MKVKDFIKEFIAHNTLIRLWYRIGDGKHEMANGDVCQMEWKLSKGEYARHR